MNNTRTLFVAISLSEKSRKRADADAREDVVRTMQKAGESSTTVDVKPC